MVIVRAKCCRKVDLKEQFCPALIYKVFPSKINQLKVSQETACDVIIGYRLALLPSYLHIFSFQAQPNLST